MNVIQPLPAKPKFKIGQRVAYSDHHNREQVGAIKTVEAMWAAGETPFLTYTVEHPTYRNKRIYLGEVDLRLTNQ